MALIRTIQVGTEIIFDIRKAGPEAEVISLLLTEKGGRAAQVTIRADKSIPIRFCKRFEYVENPKFEDFNHHEKIKE